MLDKLMKIDRRLTNYLVSLYEIKDNNNDKFSESKIKNEESKKK